MNVRERNGFRSILTVFATMALMLGALMVSAAPAAANHQQFGVCHATGSTTNPFVYISPDQASGHINSDESPAGPSHEDDRAATPEEFAAGACEGQTTTDTDTTTDTETTTDTTTETTTDTTTDTATDTDTATTTDTDTTTDTATDTDTATATDETDTETDEAPVVSLPETGTGSGDGMGSTGIALLALAAIAVLAGFQLTRRPANR